MVGHILELLGRLPDTGGRVDLNGHRAGITDVGDSGIKELPLRARRDVVALAGECARERGAMEPRRDVIGTGSRGACGTGGARPTNASAIERVSERAPTYRSRRAR